MSKGIVEGQLILAFSQGKPHTHTLIKTLIQTPRHPRPQGGDKPDKGSRRAQTQRGSPARRNLNPKPRTQGRQSHPCYSRPNWSYYSFGFLTTCIGTVWAGKTFKALACGVSLPVAGVGAGVHVQGSLQLSRLRVRLIWGFRISRSR